MRHRYQRVTSPDELSSQIKVPDSADFSASSVFVNHQGQEESVKNSCFQFAIWRADESFEGLLGRLPLSLGLLLRKRN